MGENNLKSIPWKVVYKMHGETLELQPPCMNKHANKFGSSLNILNRRIFKI
jgi:hypothetical protein